jgi:ribosomal protein L11 methyltransferase
MLIRFNCDEMNSEELSELLFECGVLSVSVEGESEKQSVLNDEKNWGDLQKTKSWQTALLRANFPASFDASGLADILQAAYPDTPIDLSFEDVVEKDWVSDVQKNWAPLVIDDLTIRFPWHSPEAINTKMNLVLEGGAAFGTGDHPTTRLCTRWLARTLREDKQATGLTVLDFGCGSAILGLAALRYGAASADGIDIDRDALASAKNNCELNGLKMGLYLATEEEEDSPSSAAQTEAQSVAMNALRGGSATDGYPFPLAQELQGRRYDLVVANILAPILIYLAPQLAEQTKPGGRIALSGLVMQQAQTVMAAFIEQGFEEVKVEEEEENWVCITGKRSADTWSAFLQARQERAV